MSYERTVIPLGTFCCAFVAGPGIAPDSVRYHEGHRDWHIARFPATDHETRQNLERLIASAMKRGERVS